PLRAELGAQPPHVDVDGPGAPVVVHAPDLLQQLLPGDHPAAVLHEVLEQLELLVGEVQRLPAGPHRPAVLVDDDVGDGDRATSLRRAGRRRRPVHRPPQPGLGLGRPGRGEEEVVDRPLVVEHGDPALGEHREEREVELHRRHGAGRGAGLDQLGGGVDEDDVGHPGQQRGGVQPEDRHPVPEEVEGRQHPADGPRGAAGGQQCHVGHLHRIEAPERGPVRPGENMWPVPRRSVLTPSAQVALLVLVAGVVLGVGALSGPAQLGAGLVLSGLVLAWGWAGALALPSPRGSAALLASATVGLVLAVTLTEGPPWLSLLGPALGLAVVAALVHQVLRRDGRPRLVESLSGVVLGVLLIAAGTLLVPASADPEGRILVLAALTAGVGAAATDVAGRWPAALPWVVPGALLVGGALAVLVRYLGSGEGHWSVYLLLGVATAAVGHAVRAVLSVLPTMAH